MGLLDSIVFFFIPASLTDRALLLPHLSFWKCLMQDEFDSLNWKKDRGNYSPSNGRRRMVKDLRDEHLQRGQSKSHIRNLLGSPDAIVEKNDLYTIGVSSFGVDLEDLVLEYNEEGQLTNHYLTRN